MFEKLFGNKPKEPEIGKGEERLEEVEMEKAHEAENNPVAKKIMEEKAKEKEEEDEKKPSSDPMEFGV